MNRINEYDDGYASRLDFERDWCDTEEDLDDRLQTPRWVHLRVYLHSTGGFYAQYDGHVDIWIEEDLADMNREVLRKAVKTLAATAFPDRASMDFWRLDRFERLGKEN